VGDGDLLLRPAAGETQYCHPARDAGSLRGALLRAGDALCCEPLRRASTSWQGALLRCETCS
jgi:hypothetical protein